MGDAARKGIDASLKKLGLDYVDLYLIHQPTATCPAHGKSAEDAQSRKDQIHFHASNMTPNIWNHFVPQFDTMPAVNQVECHLLPAETAAGSISARGTALPISGHGDEALLTHPLVTALAHKYNKTAGQIILHFEVQEGFVVPPKSTNPQHMADNIAIFDFSLTDEDMARMRGLDTEKAATTWKRRAWARGDMLLNAYKVHE